MLGEMVMVQILLRAHAGKHRCGAFMNIITMQYSKDTLFMTLFHNLWLFHFSKLCHFCDATSALEEMMQGMNIELSPGLCTVTNYESLS